MKWKLSKSLVISSGNEVTGIEMEEVFNYHRIYIMCVCQRVVHSQSSKSGKVLINL